MKNPFSIKLLATAPASELYKLHGKVVVAALLLLACGGFAQAQKIEALPLNTLHVAEVLALGGQVTTPPSIPFFYVVSAVDANARESVFSNEASALLTPTSTSITEKWTASVVPAGGPAISGYNVWSSKTAGGPYAKMNAALVTGVTSFIDPFPVPAAPSGLTAAAN